MIHQRRKGNEEYLYEESIDNEANKKKSDILSLRVIILWLATLIAFAFWRHTWLPNPKSIDIPIHEFSEARARSFLHELQNIEGFRTVGSTSNEIETPKWLLNHLKRIQEKCVEPCNVDIDIQKPTGAFGLDFLSQFQNIYANVSNILVRVQRTTHTADTPALLISSHYDAAVGAGAASDDGVNIAIMLELLQNIVASEIPLHNAVIFNFNGGEETMLQAAHGFITQHPWKDQVVAFINLEAVGAGGRELLFQTGSDVLAMAYAKGAPYPHASTIAQEVFKSGVIPGITDYEAYSEHGDVAGMDFAYIANGYVYHTPLDDISRIQEGAIQRFGENIRGTMQVLFDNPDMLSSIASKSESQGHIFFDVFGYMTITLSENVSGWMNYLVVVFGIVYCGIWSPLTLGQRWEGLYLLIKMNMYAVLLPFLVAGVLSIVAPMSWYASPATHLWVFIFPSTFGFLVAFSTMKNTKRLVQSFVEGLATMWMGLSILLMAFGIQSVYLCIIWVAFPLFSYVLCQGLHSSGRYSPQLISFGHLLGTSIPYLYLLQIYIVIFQVFIPIMGRLGNLLPPDLVVSVLASLLTTITLSNFAPILCFIQESSINVLKKYLVLGSVASLIVAILSNPYSDVCPKRIGINHVYRNFSRLDLPDDWGLWVNGFDFQGMEPLRSTLSATSWHGYLHPPAVSLAPIKIFDNYPWFYPISKMIPPRYSWFLPTNPPDVKTIPTYVDVVASSFDEAQNLRKIHFFFTGPSHLNLYIDAASTKLTSWSLGNGRDGVPPKVDESYILQFASGSPVAGFHFWIEVESNATLNVAYCGFYLDQRTPEMNKFISLLPSWSTESHAVASWGIFTV